jgi:hypothetical protein
MVLALDFASKRESGGGKSNHGLTLVRRRDIHRRRRESHAMSEGFEIGRGAVVTP